MKTHRYSGCPRKGERVSVLWLKPGTTTVLSYQPGTVFLARPSRGIFVAELDARDGEGGFRRVNVNVDEEGFGWRAA